MFEKNNSWKVAKFGENEKTPDPRISMNIEPYMSFLPKHEKKIKNKN